ncbi:MAG: thiamine ABC transporter substrate-binding protein [Micrococcales bacterium]|nr:thiamine ABC transporter substrate-binding protein [Micrococcales bacterium]
MKKRRRPATLATLVALTGLATVALTSCESADQAKQMVKLFTHSSFVVTDQQKADFKAQTGWDLEILFVDDAGTLASQLVLTTGNPVADAVAGLDNTFASKVTGAGALEPYVSPGSGPEQARYAADAEGSLTAIDTSDVCVNLVKEAYQGSRPPATLDDLVQPEYAGQLVVQNPALASPGLAFMLATVAAFGEDGWLDYWRQLVANGVTISPNWQDAYYTEFAGPSSNGQHPLVVSYSSSPPAEKLGDEGTTSATTALLDTCYRQVEYAGVLNGAKNPDGARALIDFFLGQDFQSQVPNTMWVYPVKDGIQLPQDWVDLAPRASEPWLVSPEQVAEKRDEWLKEWIDVVLG